MSKFNTEIYKFSFPYRVTCAIQVSYRLTLNLCFVYYLVVYFSGERFLSNGE